MATASDTTKPYVFISYASADRERVLHVVNVLQGAGITCWLDQHNIAGGTNWGGSIAAAIQGCAALVLMSSSASLSSRNVRQEIALAWQHDKPYLPLRLDMTSVPTDLAYWLATAQWIEVLDHPVEVWLPKASQTLAHLSVDAPAAMTSNATTATLIIRPLPIPVTPIVGRAVEIRKIMDRLSTARLVTLIGMGGTGKTRLAQEVALRVQPQFPDGVIWVDLASIADPALVIPTIATALGIKESGGQLPRDMLPHAIGTRRILLILDNMEQVIEAVRELSLLLSQCPLLHLLVTSRVALRVSAEQEILVAPLAVPEMTDDLERLLETEAVAFFVQRAQAARPAFRLTSDNASAVTAICRRLDGLPLALELAAARIKVLPPQRLLERLAHPLDVLSGGGRDLPQRQQTLRTTIQWSYDLLSEAEQRLLRHLSVFVAGWTLEAAEAIVDADNSLGMNVLDDLLSLVVNSVVLQREQPDGEIRFDMLAAIREYGLERLEEHREIEGARKRHLRFLLALAEQAEPHLRGSAGPYWFDIFEAEHDNIRNALAWGIEHEPVIALDLAVRISRFWHVCGYLTEGQQWLTSALARNGSANPSLRASAVTQAGGFAVLRGDFTRARTLFDEGFALASAVGDKTLICSALNGLGWTSYEQEDYASARSVFEQCLVVASEIGDSWRIGLTLAYLGNIAAAEGRNTEASSRLDEALSLLRASNDIGNTAWVLDGLAALAYREKNLELARSSLQEVLTIRRERRDAEVIRTLEMMATLMADEDQPEQAVQLLAAATRLRETTGYATHLISREEYRRLSERLRAILTDDRYATWWAKGWTTSFDNAIALALDSNASPGSIATI